MICIGAGLAISVWLYLRPKPALQNTERVTTPEVIENKYLGVQPSILFTDLRGGAIKDAGTKYRLHAKTENKVSGICNFVFTRGAQKVLDSVTIQNTNACQITRPAGFLGEFGEWNVKLYFEGNEGQFGYAENDAVAITDSIKENTIKITTLSAYRAGSVIRTQALLSDFISGLCIFSFRNGSYVISKEVKIIDSSSCDLDIPLSDFPYTHMWSMNVVFMSADELLPSSGTAGRDVFLKID